MSVMKQVREALEFVAPILDEVCADISDDICAQVQEGGVHRPFTENEQQTIDAAEKVRAALTLLDGLGGVDEGALEAAARAVASARTTAYEDDKIWAEDLEWQRRRQDGGAPFPQARAAITAYLNALGAQEKGPTFGPLDPAAMDLGKWEPREDEETVERVARAIYQVHPHYDLDQGFAVISWEQLVAFEEAAKYTPTIDIIRDKARAAIDAMERKDG